MMLLLFFVTTCIFSESSSLTENDWRDAALRIYGQVTKHLSEGQFGKVRNLVTDDAESVSIGGIETTKDGLREAEHDYFDKKSIKDTYISLAELLYASPEVAVVRHGSYEDMRDGSHTLTKGLTLLIGGADGVKIKTVIFNTN